MRKGTLTPFPAERADLGMGTPAGVGESTTAL
jgi:hypothetical protein